MVFYFPYSFFFGKLAFYCMKLWGIIWDYGSCGWCATGRGIPQLVGPLWPCAGATRDVISCVSIWAGNVHLLLFTRFSSGWFLLLFWYLWSNWYYADRFYIRYRLVWKWMNSTCSRPSGFSRTHAHRLVHKLEVDHLGWPVSEVHFWWRFFFFCLIRLLKY